MTELLTRTLPVQASNEHIAAFNRIIMKAEALAETVRAEVSDEYYDRAFALISQTVTVAANALDGIVTPGFQDACG